MKNSRQHRSLQGFTLLELIGVMAVMAILSAVLAPNITDAIDQAYADAEISNVDALAKSLKRYLKQTKQLPTSNTASWVNALSSQSDYSQQQVEFNHKNFRRRLIFDPRFFTSSDANFPGLTQSQGLANIPFSPRVLLVSDLTRHAIAVPNTTTAFNNVWEQTSDALLKEGKFLKIKRINFNASFQRLILSNAKINQPFYQLESGSNTSIPAQNAGVDGVITRFVITGTQLNLHQDPFPSGNLSQTLIINNDISFRYQLDGSVWHWVAQ